MKNAHFVALASLLTLAACADASEQPNRRAQAATSTEDVTSSDDVTAPTDTTPGDAQPDASPPPACTPMASSGGSANPASAYCANLGYTLDESSNCVFPNGTSCEEWAFWRGECGGEFSFCGLHGGTIASKTVDNGSWTGVYAVCTLPDGASCEDKDFAATCECK
jgi:putative hemolysin